MTLPGPNAAISLNQVNVELGNPGTTQITMNDAAVRTLFVKPTGAISMSDGWGKTNAPPTPPIASITVTMPHPQPLPGVPSLPALGQTLVQYNAGPIPGSAPLPPGFPSGNPQAQYQPASTGSSCSPNTLARQIVLGGNSGNPAISGYPALSDSDKTAARQKDVTVTYTGGPAGPGPSSNTLNLTWSVATDCPDYSPTAGVPNPGIPTTGVPVYVVSTSAPKVVVDVGLNRRTRGSSAFVPAPENPGFSSPYPGSPAVTGSPPNGSYNHSIHSRFTITGTAPAPLGGASGSTSWGVVCLPLDTEIQMEDGSKKSMGDIKVGDRVKTYNPDTNEISSNEVTHLLKRHVASELIHIKLENDIEFRATPEHECWIRREDEGMWIMAELIEVNDYMLTEGIEYKKVISVERVEYDEGIEVGNISVADAHVYFANKVLLHNFTGL